MEFVKFKERKPDIDMQLQLDIGNGHYCFATYLGNDVFKCADALGFVKLNINDFDRPIKWRYL